MKPEVTEELLDHLEAEIQEQELSLDDLSLLLEILALARESLKK